MICGVVGTQTGDFCGLEIAIVSVYSPPQVNHS